MKTEREIREKIDKLYEFVTKVNDKVVEEQAKCQIDMLLWLLDDTSGWPPIDERYETEV